MLAIIYFFLAGYVMVSMIFLAIGSLADSISDAQGYLMPVFLLLLLPVSFVLQAVLSENDGFVAQSFTWIPLWTPFSVLARLGTGIATWEKMATGILVALFIAFEFVFLGRLFRQSLLASGQKPGFGELLARMRRGRSAQG